MGRSMGREQVKGIERESGQSENHERTRTRRDERRSGRVTAHYVISTGSQLTSRLNCTGDNGNLPGHSTAPASRIFNDFVAFRAACPSPI